MARFWFGILGLGALELAVLTTWSLPVAADEPSRPTSDFGSMPNGWAGYSLLQNGLADSRQHHGNGHHGNGHHGHGHHGHGHHGHGHHGHGHHGHGHHGGFRFRIGSFCPVCLRANCFNPYCGLYTTSGISFSYGFSPAPAARLPWIQRWQAMRRPPQVVLPAAAAGVPAVVGAEPGDGAEEIRRRVSVLRKSTAGGRQRADRLIAMADRYFAAQDYRRAVSKYRQAMTQAADYPTAHFRLGQAYVASGDLELALTYFLMGLELSGSIDRGGFSLDDMYRENQVAKQTHLNILSDAALRQPDDGGLLMLVGLTLHYDGEPLRARSFFDQAAQLPGAQQSFARMFLPTDAPAAAAPDADDPGAAALDAPVRFEG